MLRLELALDSTWMFEVEAVEPRPKHRIWLRYRDGTEGEVDLSAYIGKGVFAVWKDPAVFRAVHIGPDGSIAWPGDIEMCPDSMYLKLTGKQPEEVFPGLAASTVDA